MDRMGFNLPLHVLGLCKCLQILVWSLNSTCLKVYHELYTQYSHPDKLEDFDTLAIFRYGCTIDIPVVTLLHMYKWCLKTDVCDVMKAAYSGLILPFHIIGQGFFDRWRVFEV